MTLQNLSLQVAKIDLEYYFESGILDYIPHVYLVQLLTVENSSLQKDCHLRFKYLEIIKNRLVILHQTLKNQEKLDAYFEDLLSKCCFDKSVLSFLLFQAKHKHLIQGIGSKHEINLSSCLIDFKSDLGTRIAAFIGFEKIAFLEPKSRPIAQQTFKIPKGKFVKKSKRIISVFGEFAEIIICSTNQTQRRIKGLKITLRNGQEFATMPSSLFYQESNELLFETFRVPKGQWISTAKASTSAKNDYLTDLKFYSINNFQEEDPKNLVLDPIEQLIPYHLSGLVLQQEENNDDITGIQFIFDYIWPRQDYVCQKIGLPKKCRHSLSNWS